MRLRRSLRRVWKPLVAVVFAALVLPGGPAAQTKPRTVDAAKLRQRAHAAFEAWFQDHPVEATFAGLHEWDRMPPNFSARALQARRERASRLLDEAGAEPPGSWRLEDRIAHAVYRSLLQGELFELEASVRVRRDASLPLEKTALGIFGLMIRESPPRQERARSAFWRLSGLPSSLHSGFRSLSAPEAYAARRAMAMAVAITPLLTEEMAVLVKGITPAQMAELRLSQESAATSLTLFAAALRPRIPTMAELRPLGRAAYERLLNGVHLLNLSSAEAAEIAAGELARAKRMEDPAGGRARGSPGGEGARASVRKDASEALGSLREFVERKRLLSLPAETPPFEIREMPEVVALVAPDGLMAPPGPYEPASPGLYFLPPKKTKSLYLDAALSDERLLLARQAIPGRHLAASKANGAADEIRRLARDQVTINGWSHYVEEILLDAGLFEGSPAARAAAIRLMRSHAARALVEIRIQAEVWTLEQAVSFLAEEEEIPLSEAREEALRAATSFGEAMSYTIGKWRIRRMREAFMRSRGAGGELRGFHDAFLSQGMIPLPLIERVLIGASASSRAAPPSPP